MITLSRLSTEYVRIQVTFAVSGVPQNPTTDVVQMAFTDGGATPVTGDWHAGIWETVGSGAAATYFAMCLVGPAGGVVLAPGLWQVSVRVTDSPEVPVRPTAQLTIT